MSKAKNKKSNKLKSALIGIIVMSIIGTLGYRLAHSMTIFNVRSVEVEGNKILSRERVLLYSGIAIGDNIFKVDSKEIKMNLKSDPYVKTVRVVKNFPSGIKLSIEENKDIVVIDMGEKIYLGQDGTILSKSDDFRGYFVPLLEGLVVSGESIVSDGVEYKNDIDRGEFIAFLSGLSKLSIHNRLNHILVEEDKVEMYLSTGEEILLGEFKDVEYKLSYVEEITKDLAEKSKYFEKIDFTRGNRVIVEEKIFGEED